MKANKIKLTEHFSLHEFECSCCHAVKLSPILLEKLEILRNLRQKPIVLTSGYRCEQHNQTVGGVPSSRHRLGRAADVRVAEPEQAEFRTQAIISGFAKVILYGKKGFVHVEV